MGESHPDPMASEKVALITGASSGIGRETARVLAKEGWAVGLLARRRERLSAIQEEIRSAGGEALVFPADVTDREAVRDAADVLVDRFGRLDALVNNAGVMPLSPLSALRVEDWERMVDVNVKGVLFGLAAALPHMLAAGGGHIVNVGSVAGRRPFPTGTVYSATKYAVRSLSAGIHLELSASSGIRVTDIEPGVVRTELMDHIADPDTREAFAARWEGLRPLEASDVAEAIRFVLEAPSHVNVNELLVRPTDQAT